MKEARPAFGRKRAWFKFGSPGRTRTADQVVNSHPLYLLSYRGMRLYRLWLGDEDSNLGKQIQSLLSCR